MKTTEEPIEIEYLTKLNEYGPADLFVCFASFEGRCVSSNEVKRNTGNEEQKS